MTKESSMNLARQRAAQAWCEPETEKITMIPELAEAFAVILDEHQRCLITRIKQTKNPYGKEDREGLERMAFERMKQLAISTIKGEHILTKDCWCNPDIEVVG